MADSNIKTHTLDLDKLSSSPLPAAPHTDEAAADFSEYAPEYVNSEVDANADRAARGVSEYAPDYVNSEVDSELFRPPVESEDADMRRVGVNAYNIAAKHFKKYITEKVSHLHVGSLLKIIPVFMHKIIFNLPI